MVAHRAESDNYYVLVISFSPQTDLNSPASLNDVLELLPQALH